MLNQHSLEEIADIYNLLGDIKKEYEEGIKPILIKNSPDRFRNLLLQEQKKQLLDLKFGKIWS